MAVKNLTVKMIDSLRPQPTRQEIGDAGCKGLRIIVQPTGAKVWAFVGRGATGVAKRTLGSAADHDLATAREWADGQRALLKQGEDRERDAARLADLLGIDLGLLKLFIAKQRPRDDGDSGTIKTLNWYWETIYRPNHLAKLRDQKEPERQYQKYFAPRIGDKPLVMIEKRDLMEIISVIRQDSRDTACKAANMIKTAFKRAVSLYEYETGLAVSPAATITVDRISDDERDQTTLSEREFRVVLDVLRRYEDERTTVAKYARALTLVCATGCRISEAVEAPWVEFDLERGSWEYTAARSKNKLPMVYDLPDGILSKLRRWKDGSNALFPFGSGDSFMPTGTRANMQTIIERECVELGQQRGVTMQEWSAHALRRTFTTLLSDLQGEDGEELVSENIQERCLNHVQAKLRRTYNKNQYRSQKKRGFKLWEEYCEGLRSPAPAMSD